MLDFFQKLFSSGASCPTGLYLWMPGLVSLHVISDGLIALACYSISISLAWLVRQRREPQFRWMFRCLVLFILACGTMHLMEIWNVWHGDDWFSGGIKALTAVASVATAILLARLTPRALALPSPEAAVRARARWEEEVSLRGKAEENVDQLHVELHERNVERMATKELLQSNVLERQDARKKLNAAVHVINALKAELGDSAMVAFAEHNQAVKVAGQLAALVESSDDAIIEIDLRGMVTSWNAGAERLFGYSASEMIGQSIDWQIPPRCQGEEMRILGLIQRGEFMGRFETMRACKDGSNLDVSVMVAAIKDSAGRIIGASKMVRDITQKKQTELALIVSELRYRRLFETAQDGILILDANTGRVIDANPYMKLLLGYSQKEFLGRTLWELGLFKGEAGARISFAEMQDGDCLRYEDLALETKDGLRVGVEVISNAYIVDQNRLIQCNFRDVSARKRAEARFRRLVDSNAQSVFFWNVKGEVTGGNDAFLHLTGYAREDLEQGRINWIALTPPEYAELDAHALNDLAARGVCESYEKEWIRKDGSRVFILVGAAMFEDNPDDGVCFVIDITERRRSEEALRLFRNLVDQSTDAFEVIDPRSARFLDVNEKSCSELGYSRVEHLGLRLFDIDPLLNESNWRERMEKIRAAGSLNGEGLHRRKDGSAFPVEFNAKWVRLDRDYIVAVVRDITERKQAEMRVREQHEAERANRAKSEFLSRMSHELRTPLNAILGFGQLLEMDGLNVEDKESVAQIIRAGKHLLGLINEVLDIARVESGKLALTPEPVSVRETLEETLCLVRPLASERRVRLEPLAGDLDCEVLSSEQRFKQVILNLLSNAVKFNCDGGTVAISCEKIEEFLRIKVTDTGRGISAANLAKLFVPFERLNVGDTVIEGTGLGLSLSKHLIEAMGGRIGVESALGKGTTFWVELPLIQGTPAATVRSLDAPIPSVAELPRCTAPRTLLYIEDNLSNLRLVERILARRPEVKLISAMQGSIGLELARQHLPDLVLLDFHLPDIQGDDILRQLRADSRTAGLQIVMLSADAAPAQIKRLRAAGANDYLTKPIDVRRFLAIVDATEPGRAKPTKDTTTQAL
jgi:PAS domain S-box-containing protein